MTKILLLLAALGGTLGLAAQSSFQFAGPTTVSEALGEVTTATLDLDALRAGLKPAPDEFSGQKSSTVITLPLPDGSFADFTAYGSPLLDNHPELGSYKLTGPWGGGRIATSAAGVSAVVRGPRGYVIIDPLGDGSGRYRVTEYSRFMALAAAEQGALACGYDDEAMPDYAGMELNHDLEEMGADAGAMKAGNEARELRVYDLIITCTGEFAQRFGGTEASVLDAFNVAVNAINSIFENEIGIRMNLVEVPGLIYLDPAVDPYVNANEGGALLGQIIGAFNTNNVSVSEYDLGHLLTGGCTDVGGVVSGSACNDNSKTRGVTCVGGSITGAALRIMAHEVAHQFGVSHSWNNCPGSEGQRASGTAFEPGSGTTIMSYAGACGNQNIGGEQAYYHVGSLQQFLSFTRVTGAAACATVEETENLTPQVSFDYADDFFIPVSTPFRLEGSGTDANGDELTFVWEQFDLGPASDIRDPEGNAPLFRTIFPTTEGNVRYFPNLSRIVDGVDANSERLPTYSRDLTFRLVARDNNPAAGGVDWEQLHFFSDESAGPFVVNDPAGDDWRVGEYREVTWDVANTDQAPVNCKRVNIVMSTDGGETFDVVLVEDVANSGSAFVTVPAAALDGESANGSALLMVEAADNIFLNVNANQFVVRPPAVPGFTLEPELRYDEICLPEVVTVELATGSILDFDNEIALSVEATSVPAGTEVAFSSETVTPGDAATLTVDLSDVRFSGRMELTVVAVAEGQDTARRTILLDVTDNDYSDLATTSPDEGTTGIILSTEFEWTDAANADTYDIQIATSPTFSDTTLFEEATDLDDTDYRPGEFFAANTLYFWRIRPTNVCGPGEWLAPNSFRTINSQCSPYASTDTPIGLPGTGGSFERESLLFIEESGTISDVNLPNVKLNYNFVSALKITLVSPAGTEVVLYDEKCFSTNKIDLGFDDDAPRSVACPPDDRRVFTPLEELAGFVGEDTFGEWTLRVEGSETGGSAGNIESWNIEFCADVVATPPSRVNNTATEVEPNDRAVIVKQKLSTTSTAFASNEVTYTITESPASGRLLLYGNEVSVGDEFTQADINGLGLFYENTDATAETDDFGFVVTTPDGGYLAVAYHDILIFEGAVVSTDEASELAAGLTAFPNPVGDVLSVRWTTAVNRTISLELLDLTGRVLQQQRTDGAAKAATVRTAGLPAGVYLLRVDGAVRRVVKR